MTLLRKKELRPFFAKLRSYLIEGYSDDEIATKLGFSFVEYDELKKKYLDHESDIALKKSTEHSYAEYVIEQRKCISDLDKLIDSFSDEQVEDRSQNKLSSRNVAGYVGAVRAKSDIIDKIVKTGQEFGLIEQRNNAKSNPGDAIFNMSKVEITQYITNEWKGFNELMMRYGDNDITAIDVGPVHQPTPKTPMLVSKNKRKKINGK